MAYDYQTGAKLFTTVTTPKVIFIGDSITLNGMFTSGSESAYNDVGYPAWVRKLTKDSIFSPLSYNFSLVGTTEQIMAGLLTQALAVKPDIAVVMSGRNDAQVGVPSGPDTLPGTTQYSLRQIYNALQSVGCTIIAVKILSQTFAQWPAAANELQALQTNNWIEAQKSIRNGFYVVDCGQSYDDQTNTTHWQPKSNYIQSDQTHPTPWGAWAVGNAIATQINSLIPSWRLRQSNVDDVFDRVKNPGGSLLPNQMFAGTGGSASGGPTGTVATGWSLTGTLVGSAAAGTKSTTTDGRPTQVVTISGTANGSSGVVTLSSTLTASNMFVNDTIEAAVDVSFGATTNIAAVYMFLATAESGTTFFTGDGKNSIISSAAGFALPTDNAASGSPALASLAYSLRTPRRTLTTAPTSVTLFINIYYISPLSTATVAGTFAFASPSVKKIPVTTL